MASSTIGAPEAAGSSLPRRRDFATLADIKQWFAAVIQPDFECNEAQASCAGGPPSSPRASFFLPVLTVSEMQGMRASSAEHNAPPAETQRARCLRRWFAPLQAGSVRSCSVALAATALGSGALGLPYAFSLTGIGLGLVAMTLAVIASSFSSMILIIVARYTKSASYSDVLFLATKSRVLARGLDLLIVLNGIGAITCILIFEGDFIPSVFASPPWAAHGLAVSRRVAILGVALLVYPLTLPSEISALRYTSVLVPTVLVVTILVVWTQVPGHLREIRRKGDELVWWHFDVKQLLTAVPIMVNAFTNQQNAIPSGNQLEMPSVARIVKATVNANIILFVLYASLGLGGYLSWGKATQGDFIKNYSADNVGIWCCRVMLAVTVYLVIPVGLLPSSRSCAQLVAAAASSSRRGAAAAIGWPLHVFSSTLCLGICAAIAVATDDIASVLGILGGVLATSIMFWFPACIYWAALWPTQPTVFRHLVFGMMIVFGTCGFASVVAMFFR